MSTTSSIRRISQQLVITCYLLPLYISPLVQGECTPHSNVVELIKTSPVILKALGARRYADYQSYPGVDTEVDNFLSALGTGGGQPDGDYDDRAEADALPANDDAIKEILITLTPETIYKGASLLKVTKSADNAAESSFHYDGQLNATLKPLGCFDSNILKLLPTEIIAFGKVVNDRPDLLRISINGLHRWSPQFENRIWKDLGWDDWSDFALCSVTCGKGVQQRFRRCLLDNPMMISNSNIPSDYYRPMGDYPPQPPPPPAAISSSSSIIARQEAHPSRGANRTDEWPKSNINRDESPYPNGSREGIGNERSNNSSNYKNENLKKGRRKKKKAKVLSTLSCEGYNIEQRDCNLFECSDDISDLLKFYRKPYTGDDLMTTSTMAPMTTGAVAGATGAAPTATRNTGYVSSWRNPTNFTIMITLKAKNITSPQSTIFSIRNSTHNLYIDQSKDGLRLYQERDETTEMLLIKFDLYDNRWHQISLSIQNGDFISIHVDCVWTSSYVVSKHLFSLPANADAEIGRGFYGELQQLLVLPGNSEKYQCSNVRTSINEVKRYIIDTFIDEDGT